MPTYELEKFGLGADVTKNPSLLEPGFARQSINMLHNRGDDRAELRKGCTRSYRDRSPASANPVLSIYEYGDNAGTRTPLCKASTKFQSWVMATPTTGKTDLRTTGQSAVSPRLMTFLNFWMMADARDNNYIGNATVAYPFQIDAPTSALTAVAAAGAGLSTGTYTYAYARLSSVTGEISPALATNVTVAVSGGNLRATLTVAAIAASEQFDKVKIYRTKTGGTLMYAHPVHSSVSIASINAGITDSTADSSLTTLSTIHTSAGASKTSRPEAATDVVQFRGRAFFIGLLGARSRMRWTQLLAYQCDSTTDARHDVEPDDGDQLLRGFSYSGVIVLFKDHSIHLMGGDVDEKSFTWQVASGIDAGIGAFAPHTAVQTPVGIIFGAQSGIFLFRPGQTEPLNIGMPIQDLWDAANMNYRMTFAGGWDPENRSYLIAFATGSSTTNNECWQFFVDTGRWSKLEFGMGSIVPSAFGLAHNSSNRLKPFMGDTNGYVYEMNTSGGNDGPISGTVAGTTSSGDYNAKVEDAAAAFATTGDGLLGIPVAVQISGANYESHPVLSNTATALTTAAWTTNPPKDHKYYVGAYQGVLSFGRLDFATPGDKLIKSIIVEFQKQTHSVPIVVGYTIDGDTEPSESEAILQSGSFRIEYPVERICVGISPYIRVVGNSHPIEILKIEIEYDVFMGDTQKSY